MVSLAIFRELNLDNREKVILVTSVPISPHHKQEGDYHKS